MLTADLTVLDDRWEYWRDELLGIFKGFMNLKVITVDLYERLYVTDSAFLFSRLGLMVKNLPVSNSLCILQIGTYWKLGDLWNSDLLEASRDLDNILDQSKFHSFRALDLVLREGLLDRLDPMEKAALDKLESFLPALQIRRALRFVTERSQAVVSPVTARGRC